MKPALRAMLHHRLYVYNIILSEHEYII